MYPLTMFRTANRVFATVTVFLVVACVAAFIYFRSITEFVFSHRDAVPGKPPNPHFILLYNSDPHSIEKPRLNSRELNLNWGELKAGNYSDDPMNPIRDVSVFHADSHLVYKYVATFEKVERLYISFEFDTHLRGVEKVRSLKRLLLDSSREGGLIDSGSISLCNSLEYLFVASSINMTASDIMNISKCPSLKELIIEGDHSVKPEHLALLSSAPALRWLSIDLHLKDLQYANRQLDALSRIAQLETVQFDSFYFRHADSLGLLAKLPNLKYVVIRLMESDKRNRESAISALSSLPITLIINDDPR